METVGSYLKRERESKNISLRELSQLTKISEIYLRYIENDELEKLPQGPYVKGYIASYSRLIEGNIDEAISLYEALNRKQMQTEAVQPDIPTHDGGNGQPLKPDAKNRKKPNRSRFGGVKSIFNTLVSSVPINRFSLKAAGAAIENLGSSIRINRKWPDKAVLFFKKIALSRSWLYALIALFGIGVLALAGFGFYHLFIYDPNPLPVSRVEDVQDKDDRPLPAVGSEKAVLPSESADATPTSEQPIGDANDRQQPEPTIPPEASKQAAASYTDPDPAMASPTSEPEKSSGPSKAATQTDTPLSGSSSTNENAETSRPTAGTERQVRMGQSKVAADPSPAQTTAEANLNVLQATVCAEIKNRMPVGVDTTFPASAQRVFVWSEIEAKQVPTKIRHIYYFKGQKISDVILDVGSTYWRTWSAKSLSDDRYRGGWRVDIATSGGEVLRRLYFAVE